MRRLLSNADHPTWGSAPPAAFCGRYCSAGLVKLWATLLRAVCMNCKAAQRVVHVLCILAGEALDTEDGNIGQQQLRHAFGSVPVRQAPGSDALMEENPDSEPLADFAGGTNSNDTGAAAQPINPNTGLYAHLAWLQCHIGMLRAWLVQHIMASLARQQKWQKILPSTCHYGRCQR